jgi:hypothetical protein
MKAKETSALYRLFRWLVFKIGDTRWLGWKNFPFILTWDVSIHNIDYNEIMFDAVPDLRLGDILLHRDEGFLSNWFIGGAMIHAGVYVGDMQLVEAVSEGVLKRNVIHLLRSDRACILRPNLPNEAKDEAIGWAEKIVDFEYDVLFDFNGTEERYLIGKHGKEAKNMGVKFCCTEVPFFCYLRYAEDLKIERRRNVSFITKLLSLIGLHPGQVVVDADMYGAADCELIWCSRYMTSGWCSAMKMNDKFAMKVSEYWVKNGKRTLDKGKTL